MVFVLLKPACEVCPLQPPSTVVYGNLFGLTQENKTILKDILHKASPAGKEGSQLCDACVLWSSCRTH